MTERSPGVWCVHTYRRYHLRTPATPTNRLGVQVSHVTSTMHRALPVPCNTKPSSPTRPPGPYFGNLGLGLTNHFHSWFGGRGQCSYGKFTPCLTGVLTVTERLAA
jgi:hypothetical protein